MKKLGLVLVGSAVFSLCQTGYSAGYLVQYDSSPQSALVTCGGVQQGYTPVNVYYPEGAIKDGILRTAPCKATWVSGAQSSYATIADTRNNPTGLKTTANRPNDPNIANDITFDYQRKKDEASQKADQARQAAAESAARQNAYEARQNAANEQAKQNAAARQRDDDEAMRSMMNLNNSNKTTFCNKIGSQILCNSF